MLKKLLLPCIVLALSMTAPVHANETWESFKKSASDVAEKTRDVAGDVADRTREVAGDAVDRSKEVGQDIADSKAWKKTKEVGNATADAARSGVNKVKSYINSHKCAEEDKLNCTSE
ncbi:hypothetical protein [Marinomonas communis]|uniref:hypothetical protein n=1 Tax=Marinomonas communis TaxID=28254 RepID=UPI001D1970D7|nr:hypothetical protein [Marinomonas communis]MCC4275884.1 hypothetical protein [Marinomonas communis]